MSLDFRIQKKLSICVSDTLSSPQPPEDDSPILTSGKSSKKYLLNAHVVGATAMRGTAMYEIKVAYSNNKTSSMFKSKKDFLAVKNMFELLAITSTKGAHNCDLCLDCSKLPCISTDMSCRSENAAEVLDHFLNNLLSKLQSVDQKTVLECSNHMGVVRIMTDFLELRTGVYFCKYDNQYDGCPVSKCSLSRSLSDRYAAFDSVC